MSEQRLGDRDQVCRGGAHREAPRWRSCRSIAGKKAGGGRKHQAAKSVKHQTIDLQKTTQSWNTRSKKLCLADGGLWDQLMNLSPSKFANLRRHFLPLIESLQEMSDIIGDQIALANKVLEAFQDDADTVDADAPVEVVETIDAEREDEAETTAQRAAAAAASAARRRRSENITR
jgi:hypothetical protein